MNIYNYADDTKEFLFITEAEKDQEETKLQGEFIPLIPANATLKEVPGYNQDNEIPIFENETWVIKPDYRKNYYKVDDNLNVLDIDTIGEQTGIIVDKTTGDLIKQNPNKYKIEDNTVIEKTSEEYEQEQAEKEKLRIQELFMTRSDFFDATIRAFGADEDDLLTAVGGVLAQMEIDNTEAKIALNNYKNALNFYRKHPLFTMLSNVNIPISAEVVINISSEQWDKFFDETNKKNPNAYKELLPSIE